MIFTLPSKHMLPIVSLLFCLISDKGINALDMDMGVTDNYEPKIIGGTDVDAYQYPWYARGVRGTSTAWSGCGGTLVSPEFVLTGRYFLFCLFG